VPRDQIKFQISGEPTTPYYSVYRQRGEISAPLLGAVKVSGLSLRETESMMEKRYRDGASFLNPQVILSFESYAPRTISVLGKSTTQFKSSFSIERDQMGIVSAITRAGGFTRVARTDAVRS